MADARPLLRIRGGIKAQSVWLCRGGRVRRGRRAGERAVLDGGRRVGPLSQMIVLQAGHMATLEQPEATLEMYREFVAGVI